MTSNPTSPAQTISYLDRPDGRIGYEVDGNGPLVVLVPGMGDLRSAYRFLAPVLRSAGYRVACTDLRGHGDSDPSFASYGDVETAGDITALIEELGGPAVVVGNSMGAGAAVYAAAERPELISGLVLVGPFVRNAQTGVVGRAASPGRHGAAVGRFDVEVLPAQALQRPAPRRLRRVPRHGRRKPAAPGIRQGLLADHPH